MLTLLGIILIHQNGLKWCKTLDAALLGNWAPNLTGRPRLGTYVCTSPRDDQLFTREFRGRVGHRKLLNGQPAGSGQGQGAAARTRILVRGSSKVLLMGRVPLERAQ